MSAFTALNGGSPRAAEDGKGSGNSEARRATPEDQCANGQATPSDPKRAGEVSTNQKEKEGWAGPGPEQAQYQPANYPNVEGSHKRKRSETPESRREALPAAPERVERPGSHQALHESREPYESPRGDYRPYGEIRREAHDSWPTRPVERERRSEPADPQSAAPDSAMEEHVGDALRRATSQMDAYEYANTSPDEDERPDSSYAGQYTPEQRRDGVIQMDPKKRKRNFSNRTKTGCLTCRRRKKKCDETKPECTLLGPFLHHSSCNGSALTDTHTIVGLNCLRGSFVCQGYPSPRGSWQKPDSKPATIQIESKDPSYVPPGAFGMREPQPPAYGNPAYVNQHKRDPLGSYRGQNLRIDPPTRPNLHSDDDRLTASTIPSASVASPNNKLSALSAYTTTPANVFPTPVSAAPATAFSDRTPKEYQRMPPVHDLGRPEPEHPHRENTLPQINIFRSAQNSSPVSQPPSSGVQATAALALSHTQFPSNRPRREKEEMLNRRPFYPFDKELVLERERCSAACWRFNNASNPNIGVSPVERTRLFREILQPREGVQISPTATSPVTHVGRVGDETVVEVPFACDYGYNIHIGKNVYIQRNCTIIDACEVRIGDNVTIGPNVSIYTASLSTDPRRRGGSKGPQHAMPITIEDDVFIGGSVILLPGVTVGKGSTVGAGSVVSRVCF